MRIFLTPLLTLLIIRSLSAAGPGPAVTPNQFKKGSDSDRIDAAIKAAQKTSGVVVIPAMNANGSRIWKIDRAILLPNDITVMLDNCTIQLSDSCRDNMFRSDNVGIGITDPVWSKNIHIIGIGEVYLKGAENPRATGDGARRLALDPEAEIKKGNWRISYGSDAGDPAQKQTGDWRNIMILIAKVENFSLKNVNIQNSHAWAVSFERTRQAKLSDIHIHNPEEITVRGKKVKVFNKDGIDLRQGCKNFTINNISGFTGDDFIALSSLDVRGALHDSNGSITSTMVTTSRWNGPQDDTEQIFITNVNCESICRGIAIRASDSAGIHHVYIQGLISREVPGQGGKHNAVLIGGKGYGAPSQPGKINHIQVMNVMSTGHSPFMIEAPVADCHFMNAIYEGRDKELIHYAMDKSTMRNITETNLKKVGN
ncbi:glycosyl hydrolase family 28 protein [Dyadobacter sp. 676]|uniref:Glycosyl hydrolase family 28 protein n=1 Tax=Dyadobacter sp. 676 TaxID=3088362 RepID=A0AAU8FKN8_9BACT